MVDRVSRREQDGVVTVFANIAGLDVACVLAQGFDAIVAADTIPHDVDVIEIGRDPAIGRVTIVTGVSTRDMCRIFTCCNRAVVTG